MAEHKPGQMDISENEKTFDSFIRFVTRSVIVILVAVVLLAIWNA